MALLVIVVLLLVIMPALLYLVGWGVKRYVGMNVNPIVVQAPKEQPSEKPDGEALPRVES
jgi:uncharacterized membrane protein YesL